MAITRISKASSHIRQLWTILPGRQISTSRRLQSQEWQQHGVPGTNMPFSAKNKYLYTLGFYIYVASGFLAPFIITRNYFLRQQEGGGAVGFQELTTYYCPVEEEEKESEE